MAIDGLGFFSHQLTDLFLLPHHARHLPHLGGVAFITLIHVHVGDHMLEYHHVIMLQLQVCL